jgi:serine/threonine-protein kinase
MAGISLGDFVEQLRRAGALEEEQLDQVVAQLKPRALDASALANELVRRGWLTSYQAREALEGRGAGLLLGPYVLLGPVGQGGMGEVFTARHRIMKRVVALKVLRTSARAAGSSAERFLQEIEAVAALAHPHIVTAHDAGRSGADLYFAMEHLEGATLKELVKRQGPLPVPLACAWARQAALGLQHAHEKGIIHRDVKPSNLFVTRAGSVVKVLDLGLARLAEAEESGKGRALTRLGTTVGTPDYMAPEQVRDSREVDARADVYALGCVLYFALAGKPPFSGGSQSDRLQRHLHEEPPPVRKGRPDVPEALAGVLARMLAKKPQARYQSAAEAAAALEPFARGAVFPVLPEGQGAAVPPAHSHHGLYWICYWVWVASAAVLALAGVLLLALRLHEQHLARRQARLHAAGKAAEPEEDETSRKVHPLHDSSGGDANRVHRFPRALVVSSRHTGNWELFLVSPDNGDVKNLTNHAAADNDPDCSPDGKRIAFISDRDGTPNVWVMGVNGSGLRQLTADSAPAASPRWSPDGRRIAFVSARDGTENLWVMDADGSNVRQLTADKLPTRQPAWSPDGSKLTFARHPAGAPPDTFLLDAGGGKPINLTPGGGVDACWSPDGKRIAFTARRGTAGYRLYVMDADGSNVRPLSSGGNTFGNVYPAWSPGGRRIAFTDFVAGAPQVAVCEADGGPPTTLTSEGLCSTPRWSPDGMTIAFLKVEGKGRTALWVMDADGKNQREVQHGVGSFSWRPR